MKKQLLTIVAALFAGSMLAQGPMTIKMSAKTEGLPAEYASFGEMDIVTYVNGDLTKTEVSNAMMNSTTLMKGDSVISLTDAMGNKSGYRATKAEMESMDKDKKGDKPKIEYVDGKMTIAGYECKKALVKSKGKDGKEQVTTVWYTEKINMPEKNKSMRRNMVDLGELKGMPMMIEMSMNTNGMDTKMTMTVTEISTAAIDDSVFKLDYSGYKLVSYKDFVSRQRQMGGGH